MSVRQMWQGVDESSKKRKKRKQNPYHVFPKVVFFISLESSQVFEHPSTGILDVFL